MHTHENGLVADNIPEPSRSGFRQLELKDPQASEPTTDRITSKARVRSKNRKLVCKYQRGSGGIRRIYSVLHTRTKEVSILLVKRKPCSGVIVQQYFLLSAHTLEKAKLQANDLAWLQYREHERPFVPVIDETIPYKTVSISLAARQYLCMDTDKKARLMRKPIPLADEIYLCPTGTTENLSGRLLHDFVNPYFTRCTRLINVHDHIFISSGACDIEFKVLSIKPLEYGFVTQKTNIVLSGLRPYRDLDMLESLSDYARELQKELDYVYSSNYASSIARISFQFGRLIDQLEALDLPPMY
ncbi:uncharacterized protein BO88DRAFT_421459 [Aspergillus vadensis CBS 113365]|uniref:Uncharacterized protein n=1 Tax=Aspergillus vadensis (strain CBS 113365 / IMI 142717 / IBT 24658) TaxID=1448311 RepID=A0A319CIG5_ASPVC|nr:hypothetical protein BO88DRAFT_421459 [Aspergillus vadensis CBS 113365]PYH75158.1 hypothetical protein BO88DRAFT_421459 [Aspergillus vadensis CBS 113365]